MIYISVRTVVNGVRVYRLSEVINHLRTARVYFRESDRAELIRWSEVLGQPCVELVGQLLSSKRAWEVLLSCDTIEVSPEGNFRPGQSNAIPDKELCDFDHRVAELIQKLLFNGSECSMAMTRPPVDYNSPEALRVTA